MLLKGPKNAIYYYYTLWRKYYLKEVWPSVLREGWRLGIENVSHRRSPQMQLNLHTQNSVKRWQQYGRAYPASGFKEISAYVLRSCRDASNPRAAFQMKENEWKNASRIFFSFYKNFSSTKLAVKNQYKSNEENEQQWSTKNSIEFCVFRFRWRRTRITPAHRTWCEILTV